MEFFIENLVLHPQAAAAMTTSQAGR